MEQQRYPLQQQSLIALEHPFTCLMAGPTGCGKSMWAAQLIQHQRSMIHPPPEKIVWHYGEWQERLYGELARAGVKFVDGLPTNEGGGGGERTLMIIDDLMAETDERITKLFTKGSHHRNLSVVYLVQNVFSKNKEHRTISLNAQYMVLFKNPRDVTQIVHLAKQMYPGQTKYVEESFRDATSRPHGYLFVDLKQNTPEHLRLRTNIFEPQTYVYVKK